MQPSVCTESSCFRPKPPNQTRLQIYAQLCVKTPACHSDLDVRVPLEIGNIPLKDAANFPPPTINSPSNATPRPEASLAASGSLQDPQSEAGL